MTISEIPGFEYIVVGSGAGGGTVAARLAENGRKVLVLEAGGDPARLSGGDTAYPDENRLPDDYDVPAFHPFSTENEAMQWDFWVRHYEDDARQRKDEKFREMHKGQRVDGVWYPRAGCLGGCTAHNAMILVYPHNEDFDGIAKLTGDASWGAENMRRYFEKLENCHYRALIYRWLAKLGINPTRHGWNGWLRTETTIPKAAIDDVELIGVLKKSIHQAIVGGTSLLRRFISFFRSQGDPNDWRLLTKDAFGIHYTPLTTCNHSRMGTRERLLDVQSKYPRNLTIELDALATRVLFDDQNRAVGVEYLKGARLYQAHAGVSEEEGDVRQVLASKEVILAGGAFNTPQLLMLSGIGPKAALEKHGIRVRVDLPGVGVNLQDRYEVGVVNRVKADWSILRGAKYHTGDPQYELWSRTRRGVYASNGAVLGVITRSASERPVPDLFCFALLSDFRGYFPGYAAKIAESLNYLTWCVLKAHTNNRAGEVRLKSKDPRERPFINFKYFEEGNDAEGEDLDSVVDGVKFVRQLSEPLLACGIIEAEEGPAAKAHTDEEIRDFVRYQSWGHHASCTCAIGPDGDERAVLDSNFTVRGTHSLRVVDASAFPRIPGFFIVSAVYMIAEKAADVILAAAPSAQLNAATRPAKMPEPEASYK